jgi:hypothetical protein
MAVNKSLPVRLRIKIGISRFVEQRVNGLPVAAIKQQIVASDTRAG